jgi:SAM-dependent methyltransferase
MQCRLCKGDLYPFWDAGLHPHSDQFRKTKDEPETRYPLRLMMCECGLAQIDYNVEKEVMYTDDYLYEASITQTASKHWGELADDVIKMGRGKRVLDIGGNDGTLALKFKERGCQATNIDPCKEVTDISRQKVDTITDFFPSSQIKGTFDIITGTNVFAHVHDHDAFMKGIDEILEEDGIFVFESPYFGEFFDQLEYSTVYHQHILYLSLKPLIPFLKKHGFEIFDVRFTELHGGGFRVFISRQGKREVSPKISEAVAKENWTKEQLIDWGKRAKAHSEKLFEMMYEYKRQGKTICCVSSPAKGMTLLNYSGIGRFIDFVTEKSQLKIGRFTPGDRLPIVGDEELEKESPDYMLLLAWNFEKEIISSLKSRGIKGKIIIPLQEIKIIDI